MQTREWRFADKSAWGDGPWQNEPDKKQWQDPGTGLACLMLRNKSGAWCGYVGVPKSHPAHGKGYDDVDVEVHGGLTFSAGCQKGREERTICHVVGPGEPDDTWWLGFDCSHAFDLMPGHMALLKDIGHKRIPMPSGFEDIYRDADYVQGEVTRLAQQLAGMAHA